MIFLFIMALFAEGLIFRDGLSPAANTEMAPTGEFSGSGWEHQVYYLNYHATVISPKHVITARHLGASEEVLTRPIFFGGSGDDVFAIKGERILIGDTDFAIFEIWETFPSYAGLYQGGDEAGRAMVIHGSGLSRGDEITGKGWKWGEFESRQSRWGRNVVKGSLVSGGSDLLYFSFDDVMGQSEVMATGGDSGGGWFIEEGGIWKLAGVSFAVDSLYSESPVPTNANGFRGAFYNGSGLSYGDDGGGWGVIPATGQSSVPGQIEFYRQSHSYGSRISSRLADIEAVIAPTIAWSAMDPGEKFEAWLSQHGVISEVGAADDFDGDGLSNLEEYLAESHPSEAGDARPALTLQILADGIHQVTLRESLDLAGRGLVAVVESSMDLVDWDPVEDLVEESLERDDPGGVQTRVLHRLPGEGGRVFYQLRVSLIPSG